MDDKLQRADAFAARAHDGQTRKFTGEPYINHPRAVLALLRTVPHSEEMACAALLHDTVEDCGISLAEIERQFGPLVAHYVECLTAPAEDDKERRKQRVRRRLAAAPPQAQSIKLADIIDNIHNVAERDAEFARSYMAEKRAVIDVLRQGDATLWRRAKAIVDDYDATNSATPG